MFPTLHNIDTLRTAAREGAGEAAASSASALEEARAALEEIDADGLGAAPARYHAVAAGLRALPLEAQLPRLSTYLGHTDPAHTYWYIEAVPELLQLASERATRSLAQESGR